MRIAATLLLAAAVVGCGGGKQASTERASPPVPPPTRKVVATVEGTFDGKTLTFRPIAETAPNGLVEIPVVQDGVPGSNPPDTVELVTESIEYPVEMLCSTAIPSLRANVAVRSFYSKAILDNVHFEITRIPTGYEACNSADPAPAGTSRQFGLFSYGALWPVGWSSNVATATWWLNVPDQAPYTFQGRIVADVYSDTTPPTTSATPAGRYADWATFSATCSDDMIGCAGTYYTLDGSEPTTDSPQYGSPVDLWSTTTVKVFSVDVFGNEEPVQTLEYVVDVEPPTVVATSPAAWSVGNDPAVPLTVTFSEPVDPASVWVTLDGMRIDLVPDPSLQTYTASGSVLVSPGFPVELSVMATDTVGRVMAAPYSARFEYGNVPPATAATGTSTIVNHDLLANGLGDVVAVWSDSTGAGGRLYASHRFAGQAWSSPMLLDEGIAPDAPFQARLSETSKGFLIVWSGATGTRAGFIGTLSGTVDWTRTLWADPADPDSLGLSRGSEGAICCTVARASQNQIAVILGDAAGNWQPPVVLDSRAQARWPRVAVSPADGLPRVFFAADDGHRVVAANGSGWLPSTLLPVSGAWPQVPPVAFETSAGVEVVWAPSDGGVFAAEDTGLGLGAPVQLSTASFVTHLAGAGRGDQRAVTWDDLSDGWLDGAIHVPGAWLPEEGVFQLQTQLGENVDPELADDHTVVALSRDFGTVWVVPAFLNASDVPTWGGGVDRWSPQGQATAARAPQIEDGTVVTWAGGDGAGSDGLWSVDGRSLPAALGWARLHREALEVGVAVGWGGIRTVGWVEEGPAGREAWEMRGYDDVWEPAAPASGTAGSAVSISTVAAGRQAWSVFTAPSASMPGYASITTHWGDPPLDILYPGGVELATAGSATEAVIAQTDGCAVGANVLTGAWMADSLFAPAACDGVYELVAAAGEAGTLVAWRTWWGQLEVRSPFGALASWTYGSGVDSPRVAVGSAQSVAPLAAVAWHLDGAIYASVLALGGPWGTPLQISPPATSCSAPQLASDGGSFLAVFECGTELRASRFDGTAWSAPFLVTTDPLGWSLAGAPSGYRVALVHDDWDGPHAFQIKINGTVAEMPTRIDTEPGAVRPRIKLNADVGFFCAGWSQVVDDPLAAQPRARCFL